MTGTHRRHLSNLDSEQKVYRQLRAEAIPVRTREIPASSEPAGASKSQTGGLDEGADGVFQQPLARQTRPCGPESVRVHSEAESIRDKQVQEGLPRVFGPGGWPPKRQELV